MITTERPKPYEGHLKARFYQIRTRMNHHAVREFINALSDKAPGDKPIAITERFICSPDLRTHICSMTPSIPCEWLDYSVEWAADYEPTDADMAYWYDAVNEYPPDDRVEYDDWWDIVDGSREGLGFQYKFNAKVVLTSFDMGIIELDENQKEDVDEEDERAVETLLWDIAREEACANEHV